MTREEVQIRTGVDNSAVKPGMVDLNTKVKGGLVGIREEVKSVGREFKAWGKFLKGFGVLGFVNQIVGMLTPATLAVSGFLGEWSTGLVKVAKSVDELWQKTIAIRKQRQETEKLAEKNAEKAKKYEFDDASPANQMEMTKNRIAEVRKEIREIDEAQRLGLSTYTSDARLKFETLKGELQDLYHEQKKLAERAKRDEEQRLKDQYKLHEQFWNNRKKMAQLEKDLMPKRQSDVYADKNIPSLEAIAEDNQSNFQFAAQQLIDARQNADMLLRRYGRDDKGYQQAVDYAQKLEDPLRKAGLLPTDKQIAENTAQMVGQLKDLTKENRNINATLTGANPSAT